MEQAIALHFGMDEADDGDGDDAGQQLDADHHYDGACRDWELYRKLVPDTGVITLHDTTNYREPCGVPQLIDEIRQRGDYEVINMPIAYGTAIVKKILGREANIVASRPAGSAANRRR